MTDAPTLLEIQRAMYLGVVERDDEEASACVVADGLQPAERLGIYRNTFASALTRALRLSYPAVHRLVGAEFFDGATRRYIERQPPRSACLDDYGAEFAEFLAGFPPASSLSYLPEVARLEWEVNRALHAPDALPLEVSRLAELSDAERAAVRFLPHPSVGLIRTGCPADIIWRSVLERDEKTLASVDPGSGPVWLLVHRSATGVEVIRMNQSAWRFTLALCAGEPLEAALAGMEPDSNAPALIAEHLAAGRFIGFSLAEANAGSQCPGGLP